ncbi:coiled-coil domain-containing protein 42 homolog [Plectropomus leopardus]|uniref:coiled-coil domain-containing protein 42 homolog n=1 Tax=Plectropomus leopardus TaxID=160734 RepID=UPI001C4C61AD|nr:coiled-coil domain-containing protein 42 homolog [Plectropomus leopardus]
MSGGSGGEERCPQRSPAGASGVVTGGPSHNTSFAHFDLLRKRREQEELDAKLKERKQRLESVQQSKVELQKKLEKVKELHSSCDFLLKDADADRAVEKAERERTERLHLAGKMERLKVEHAKLIEMKQELQRQVQRHSVYPDFMECVVKMTKFDNVQELTGHLESLLHFRDHLYQKEIKAQEQVHQQRKELRKLEDQHRLLRLQKNNQLSQLQTELEKTCSEALIWGREWTHIEETAAKKTLTLGKIKMATLNLYEMIDDKVEGEESVDINDTEKQLDKAKIFIKDHQDIVKQHQTPLQKQDGKKKEKSKKRIATNIKKTA